MSYNSYHTDLKLAVFLGLVPSEGLHAIPKSTLHRFKKTDFTSIIGMGSTYQLEEKIRIAREFVQSNKALKLFKSALYLRDIKIKLLKLPDTAFTKSKEFIVNSITRVKDVMGFSRATRFFSISIKTFHNWRTEIEHSCLDSVFHKCVKAFPNQLTNNEVQIMKRLLSDRTYSGWSIRSRACYALMHDILSVCVSTWYKYVKLLGLERKKVYSRRKNYKIGIRAEKPHEIWHMDVTVFKTMDNVKAYIHILIDNYSRCILGYRVSLVNFHDTDPRVIAILTP